VFISNDSQSLADKVRNNVGQYYWEQKYAESNETATDTVEFDFSDDAIADDLCEHLPWIECKLQPANRRW
jgi:hypothetical protein